MTSPTPYMAGPFDSAHLYLQWGGKLPGNESWSNGIRLAVTDNASTSLDPGDMIAEAVTAIQAFHTNQNSQIATQAKLSFVKLNYIGTNGLYAENSTFETVLPDVAGGQSTGSPQPNQIAIVVSLLTGFSRGPAHRGRFYVPMPAMTPGTDGLVAATSANALKGTADTLITSLNAIDPGYKVAVFSRKLGAPAHRLVTTTSVGRVLDTQRRRRRSLPETYN